MTKHKNEFAHLFITQALTNPGVNLSVYKDEAFRNSLRLVAIDSIISILSKIYSKKQYAQEHGEVFSIIDSINQVHPITGLNMLDYCLAAGFNDMALSLVRHGVVSKNLQSFRHNVNNSFPEDDMQPDIVRDIYAIINGCLEIKKNYEHFVTQTHVVLPKMVSAGQRIYRGYSTPTLIMAGIGGVLLAPFLYPLIHGVGTTAFLFSAGVLPAVISGVYVAGPQRQQLPAATTVSHDLRADLPDDELAMLVELIKMAKDTKDSLQSVKAVTNVKHIKHKKHVLQHPPQVPLLFQLPKQGKIKKTSNSPAVSETLKNSMA